MGAPTTVQEAKKAQQLERVKRKGGIKTAKDAREYAGWYGKQPQEVERARSHATHQEHVVSLAAAAEALDVAMITGERLDEAKHEFAVAELVAARSVVPKRGAGAVSTLSASNTGGN
jgi:hypothetical protein